MVSMSLAWNSSLVKGKKGGKMEHPIYRAIRLLAKTLFRYQVEGRENIPQSGPLVVIFNHISALDGAPLMACLPEIFALVASTHRLNVFSLLGLLTKNIIIIRRGEPDLKALKAALAVLENKGVLVVAPEGTRSKTGKLLRGQPGVAYFALKAQCPILPIGLEGIRESGKEWRRLRRPVIRLNIGRPFAVTLCKLKGEELQRVMDSEVMPRLKDLLPDS